MSVALGPGPEPTHLVEIAEFPEENQQFLMKLDFLGGVGKVGLEQGVGQQPSYALEDELEVLWDRTGLLPAQLPPTQDTPTSECLLTLPYLYLSPITLQSPIEGPRTASTPESRASAFPPASRRTPCARL